MFSVEERDALRSAETLARFEDAHVTALEPGPLRTALAGSVRELVREGFDARLPHADVVSQRLAAIIPVG